MENVTVTLRGYAGFHEATLLTDQSSSHGHIMTLWQIEEDLRTSEASVYQGRCSDSAPRSPPRPNASN